MSGSAQRSAPVPNTTTDAARRRDARANGCDAVRVEIRVDRGIGQEAEERVVAAEPGRGHALDLRRGPQRLRRVDPHVGRQQPPQVRADLREQPGAALDDEHHAIAASGCLAPPPARAGVRRRPPPSLSRPGRRCRGRRCAGGGRSSIASWQVHALRAQRVQECRRAGRAGQPRRLDDRAENGRQLGLHHLHAGRHRLDARHEQRRERRARIARGRRSGSARTGAVAKSLAAVTATICASSSAARSTIDFASASDAASAMTSGASVARLARSRSPAGEPLGQRPRLGERPAVEDEVTKRARRKAPILDAHRRSQSPRSQSSTRSPHRPPGAPSRRTSGCGRRPPRRSRRNRCRR